MNGASRSWDRLESTDPLGSRRDWLRAATRAVAAVMSLATIGCSRDPGTGSPESSAPMKVVATVGMIGDVAREVAGDRAAVTTLMGEGVDPHLYKASPGDVRLLAQADLILHNGWRLEGRLAEVIERMSSRTRVVRVTEGIPESRRRPLAAGADHVDPHAWFDVSLWRLAAGRIGEGLLAADPAGAEIYAANLAAYQRLLDDLHAYAQAALTTIPPANRVMVTAHDAFGYFGAAYGLEVLGIQGISTDSEASLRDINALVDTLASRRVPAVFIESSVPRKTIDALVEGCKSRGHAIVVGGQLFSDAMGAPGTAEGTYVGMMLHNIDVVTAALGGVVPADKPDAIASYLRRMPPDGGE